MAHVVLQQLQLWVHRDAVLAPHQSQFLVRVRNFKNTNEKNYLNKLGKFLGVELTTLDGHGTHLDVHGVELELHLTGDDGVHARRVPDRLVAVQGHAREFVRQSCNL